ncbi:hypothetical protein PDJ95_28360, partial [Bacillus cereus]|nr:hypothetical protein [Bacillus cereus]
MLKQKMTKVALCGALATGVLVSLGDSSALAAEVGNYDAKPHVIGTGDTVKQYVIGEGVKPTQPAIGEGVKPTQPAIGEGVKPTQPAIG